MISYDNQGQYIIGKNKQTTKSYLLKPHIRDIQKGIVRVRGMP